VIVKRDRKEKIIIHLGFVWIGEWMDEFERIERGLCYCLD